MGMDPATLGLASAGVSTVGNLVGGGKAAKSQNAAEQAAAQQQQQAMANDSAARQEYVGGSSTGNRPRSASGRPIITGPQRPLSAYVMRR